MILWPWILQLGPLFVPADARNELGEMRVRCSAEQYVDKIWKERYPHGNPARQSAKEIWPLKFKQKTKLRVVQ